MGKNLTVFFTGLVLAAGFAAAGGAVCYGLIAGKQANRTVSVRGLAEREVDADLAVWPLKFTVAADDLTSLNEAVKRDSAIVEAYLAKNNVVCQFYAASVPLHRRGDFFDPIGQH